MFQCQRERLFETFDGKKQNKKISNTTAINYRQLTAFDWIIFRRYPFASIKHNTKYCRNSVSVQRSQMMSTSQCASAVSGGSLYWMFHSLFFFTPPRCSTQSPAAPGALTFEFACHRAHLSAESPSALSTLPLRTSRVGLLTPDRLFFSLSPIIISGQRKEGEV